MENLTQQLFYSSGIVSGLIAGIIAAIVQVLISLFDHKFTTKTKKAEQTYAAIEWQRNAIEEMIREVSDIRVPSVTETNEDIIENAYHLIIADFERAKPLLYEKNKTVTIRAFFDTLKYRYEQMQKIKLGAEKDLTLEKSKVVLIGEINECKKRLLNVLQDKEKEIMSKMI